jgi:hypothetical protein
MPMLTRIVRPSSGYTPWDTGGTSGPPSDSPYQSPVSAILHHPKLRSSATAMQLIMVPVVVSSYIITVLASPLCNRNDVPSLLRVRSRAFSPIPHLCSYASTLIFQRCCEDHGQDRRCHQGRGSRPTVCLAEGRPAMVSKASFGEAASLRPLLDPLWYVQSNRSPVPQGNAPNLSSIISDSLDSQHPPMDTMVL